MNMIRVFKLFNNFGRLQKMCLLMTNEDQTWLRFSKFKIASFKMTTYEGHLNQAIWLVFKSIFFVFLYEIDFSEKQDFH